MNIRYTAHALYQTKKRKIEPVWIEETIRYPHRTQRSGHKWYVERTLNDKALNVVYVKGI